MPLIDNPNVSSFFFLESFIHTTHTTKAERRAEESPRRPRRRRVARRPEEASREKKNPAAAGIENFFLMYKGAYFLHNEWLLIIMNSHRPSLHPVVPQSIGSAAHR